MSLWVVPIAHWFTVDSMKVDQGSGDRQGCTPIPTYPVMGNPYISPYNTWVFMGFFIPKNPKVELPINSRLVLYTYVNVRYTRPCALKGPKPLNILNQWSFLVTVKGGIGSIFHPPEGNIYGIQVVYTANLMTICHQAHLLREPKTTIDWREEGRPQYVNAAITSTWSEWDFWFLNRLNEKKTKEKTPCCHMDLTVKLVVAPSQ